MKLREVFGNLPLWGPRRSAVLLTRDEVIQRIKTAKTPAAREKWAAYLVQNRYNLNPVKT